MMLRAQDSKTDRKRVLLLAYACNPYFGSEAGCGWQRAVQTAKYFDTWVLCGSHLCERDVGLYLANNGHVPGLYFVFVPERQWEMRMWELPRGYYVANNLWHRRAYRVAVMLHERFRFDIVHLATWCGFREPGYLWKLGTPFIWGPVGGTQNYPWRFLSDAGMIGGAGEFLRNVLNTFQFRFSPRVRSASKKAAVLLTANSIGQRDFRRVHKTNPVHMVEIGVGCIKPKPAAQSLSGKGLRVLWSGEFTHRKALQLLLRALAMLPSSCEFTLRILGQGPLNKKWHRLAQNLGIEDNCQWMGWLPHQEALRQYEWADVFVHSSLRDTSGTVILEALSHGVPVICLDHQGAKDIVTQDCGVKIPVTTPKDVIGRLRDAISFIAQDRTKLKVLSDGAIQRAMKYLWSAKGEEIAKLYHKVILSSRL